MQSDHQPVATIIKQSLSEAPKRLQRMLLHLQRYDMLMEYVPGTQMYVVDALSRAPIEVEESDPEQVNEEVAQEILATELLREGISNCI